MKLITSNFRPLFLLFAAGLFISGMLTQKDNYLVITAHAPKAILSWETNLDNAKRDQILEEWSLTYKNLVVYPNSDQPLVKKITGLQTVQVQNQADYVFIVFYVGVLLLVISRLLRTPNYNRKWNWFFISLSVLTVLAGLLDYIEDFATAKMLTLYQAGKVLPDAGAVGYPSRVKWLLLALVLVVLVWQSVVRNLALLWLGLATKFLQKSLALLWRWRVMALTLLIVFAVLYISDQGQDLLLSINAEKPGIILFLLSASVIAVLCWYLPKIMEYAKPLSYTGFFFKSVDFNPDPLTNKRPVAEVDLSRLLGAAGFLIPATGILKVMANYHIDYWFSGVPPLAILVAILFVYRVVLAHHWIDRFYKDTTGEINCTKYLLTLAVLVTPMVIWGTDENNRQPYALNHLVLDLVFLSLIFLITTTLRTCSKVIKSWPIAPFITLTGLACLLFFIACNFPGFLALFIHQASYYTMPFVFIAFAGYLLLFSYLIFISKKTGVTWITGLLALAFIGAMTTVSNYHGVAMIKGSADTAATLERYTENWLLRRESEINGYYQKRQASYPVFFVNAHGGGIRAAVWTTMVIGALDQAMRKDTAKANQQGFQHYAFAYSGASGGTIGLMLLANARQAHLKDLAGDSVFYPVHSKCLYRTDNLTSDVIALLGRDMVYGSFGLSGVPDRARLMEADWEYNASKFGLGLGMPFRSMWSKATTELPLLFSNTYDIPSGNKGIIAPVRLDTMDFPSAIFPEQEIPEQQDMRVSTAGFLSARFPYVSPTAKLNTNRHFTDGGTIENSGGETLLQVIRVFQRVQRKLAYDHPGLAHISIHIVALPNSVRGIASPEYDRNFYEPLGPPLGALMVGSANTDRAELVNRRLSSTDTCIKYLIFQPQAYKFKEKAFWPVLPLGWQISEPALEALEYNAARPASELDQILAVFGVKRKQR